MPKMKKCCTHMAVVLDLGKSQMAYANGLQGKKKKIKENN